MSSPGHFSQLHKQVMHVVSTSNFREIDYRQEKREFDSVSPETKGMFAILTPSLPGIFFAISIFTENDITKHSVVPKITNACFRLIFSQPSRKVSVFLHIMLLQFKSQWQIDMSLVSYRFKCHIAVIKTVHTTAGMLKQPTLCIFQCPAKRGNVCRHFQLTLV